MAHIIKTDKAELFYYCCIMCVEIIEIEKLLRVNDDLKGKPWAKNLEVLIHYKNKLSDKFLNEMLND